MAKSGLGVTDFTEPEAPSVSPRLLLPGRAASVSRFQASAVLRWVGAGGAGGAAEMATRARGGCGPTPGLGGPARPCPHRVSLGLALGPLRERMALAAPPSAADLELGDFRREAEQMLQATRALGCLRRRPSPWSHTGCSLEELTCAPQSLPSLAGSAAGQARPPTLPAASWRLWKTVPTGEIRRLSRASCNLN